MTKMINHLSNYDDSFKHDKKRVRFASLDMKNLSRAEVIITKVLLLTVYKVKINQILFQRQSQQIHINQTIVPYVNRVAAFE